MEHTHRMAISWWIGGIVIGLFLVLIGVFLEAGSIHDLLSGKSGFVEMLGSAGMVLLFLAFGALLLTFPIVTRVTVKPQGIRYYTAAFVLCADWKDMVTKGYSTSSLVGRAVVLTARQGDLRLRKWAKPLRWLLKSKPDQVEIVLSQFGKADGHKLEEDVIANVVHLGPLTDR